jgi:hypothetical protein
MHQKKLHHHAHSPHSGRIKQRPDTESFESEDIQHQAVWAEGVTRIN